MPLYLDNNATTALDPMVLDTMLPYMQLVFGNPSSVHRYGRLTRDALELARSQVAGLVGAQPGQVIFTSGGTEANNLAIRGTLTAKTQGRFAVSAIEHASVMDAAKALNQEGWQLDVIAADSDCRITSSALDEAVHSDTQLVSVMMANNETGAIQDIETLSGMCREKGILFHTDASQAAGKIPVNFSSAGISLMTVSSHKLYGPQGVGALIADRAIEIKPVLYGGGQERGLRSGTENIAGIVGFGKAAELALQHMDDRTSQMTRLRDELVMRLEAIAGITVFAKEADRLPNTVQFAVDGFEGETLLMQLDKKGIAVSSGSACHSGQTEPSHVLLAMGVSKNVARSAIRVSFGKDNKPEEVNQFMDALQNIIDERVN